MLGALRPSGARRSWWLREALASESGDLAAATPPLSGSITADVVVIGGGYTGLWTAWRLTELAPGVRIVVLEADICGGGPSGRNGGFVTGWWDELPTLVERHGSDGALAIARAIDGTVDKVGTWCDAHGVDAWYTKAGSLSVSAAPAQDGLGEAAVDACRALGVADEFVAMSPKEVRARVASPVFRGGIFMRGAATVQPAILARGLRRVLLERGVTIHEGTTAVELDGERPGLLGAVGAAGRRAPAGRAGRPVRVRTSSALGGGEVIARSAVVGLSAWAAAWPSFGRRLVTWSSYIVLTEPIPDRLEELGWTGGEGVADGRFTLHYLRTTPDGRIALGGGGGRAGFGGKIGPGFTDDLFSVERAAAGLRRLFPSLRDVRIEDAWGGPIDITSDHLPVFASLPGRPIHYGHGYSGNGVAPSVLGGRILAALALERADDPALALPLVGVVPRAFPPEPLRYLGARVVREAIVRTELAEERGERPSSLLRQLSRLPRRLGYHLGPE
ncbi:MAG: FAD-binding oxidoreductase [Candidatus Limnocylindrales bacterium]|nr:FAD-binding oxidoreductase [Candidatus Limnocylindrales bacterium]